MGVRYREYIASGRKYQNTTKKSGDSSGSESAIYISKEDLQRALKDFEKIAKRMRDPEWRKEALTTAANMVASAAQSNQRENDAKEVHYYYPGRTPGIRRARNSQLGSRVKIKPGNLRLSIQKLNLKKTPRVFIGPKIKDKITAKTIGSYPANSDGFYAWMSQKTIRSAEDFRRTIMEPALSSTTARVIAHLDRETAKQVEKLKNGQLRLFK